MMIPMVDDIAVTATVNSLLYFFFIISGISPDNIIATMEETDVFAQEAADVAAAAVNEGLARIDRGWEEVYSQAKSDIAAVRALVEDMEKSGYILRPPRNLLENVLRETLAEL